MKITAHTLVKNEARFIWYSVMSVLPYVDRLRIWDTGSTDGTLEIIDEIKKQPQAKGKIYYKYRPMKLFDEQIIRQEMLDTVEEDSLDEFGKIRQEMLDETTADWFIMLDADEIWWESSIKRVIRFIHQNGHKYESLIVPTINLVGDLYHYQERNAGKYKFGKYIGHYNLRGINRGIPGLKSFGPHGTWGWADSENKMIQDRDPKKIKFLNAPYLHATFLQRAGTRSADAQVLKRAMKLKYEIGNEFPLDYYYPEVFFRPRPKIVEDIWQPMNMDYRYRAFIETPLRKFKRRYLPDKVGY